jgi:hypothetical protein
MADPDDPMVIAIHEAGRAVAPMGYGPLTRRRWP